MQRPYPMSRHIAPLFPQLPAIRSMAMQYGHILIPDSPWLRNSAPMHSCLYRLCLRNNMYVFGWQTFNEQSFFAYVLRCVICIFLVANSRAMRTYADLSMNISPRPQHSNLKHQFPQQQLQ